MFKDEQDIRKVLWQKIEDLKARDKFSDNFVESFAIYLKEVLSSINDNHDTLFTTLTQLLIKNKKTVIFDSEVERLLNKTVEEHKARHFTIADEINKQYLEFDALEYRPPTANEARLVSTKWPIKIRILPKELSEQFYLDFKKRSLSFCHGAYILLKARKMSDKQQQEIMDKIFMAAEMFSHQLEKFLQHPEQLKRALKKLDLLITEMAVILTEPPAQIEDVKKTYAELLKAEVLANCERRKPCVIITPIGSDFQIETIESNHFTYDQIREISETTANWQQGLSPVQRYWLDENKAKLTAGELATPSTLLQNMPGAANVTRYELLTTDNCRYTSIGRRTLAPMNVSDEATRLRLAEQNAAQVQKIAQSKQTQFWASVYNIEPMTLEQSLLSPLQKWYIKLAEGFTGDNNNTKMLAAIDHALQGKTNVISSNWPVNAARIFSFGFQDKRNQIACNKFEKYFEDIVQKLGIPGVNLTDKIEQAISGGVNGLKKFVQNPEQANQLILAFHAYLSYREMMQQPSLRSSYAHRNPEMFAACLERLMIDGTGGIISAGCKSAKDREGTVKMHTTAMILYFKEKQSLPKINDSAENRKAFAEIYAKVHHAGHQQHMANLNSYGAQGCQNGMANILQKVINAVGFLDRMKLFNFQPMLPEDIKARVDLASKREQCQDLMARSNKVRFVADHAAQLILKPQKYPARAKPIGAVSHAKMAASGIHPFTNTEKPLDLPTASSGTLFLPRTPKRLSQDKRTELRGPTHRPKT